MAGVSRCRGMCDTARTTSEKSPWTKRCGEEQMELLLYQCNARYDPVNMKFTVSSSLQCCEFHADIEVDVYNCCYFWKRHWLCGKKKRRRKQLAQLSNTGSVIIYRKTFSPLPAISIPLKLPLAQKPCAFTTIAKNVQALHCKCVFFFFTLMA